MSEQPRISYSGGKGKLRHNNRDIVSSNVDPNRVKDNITFISMPVRVAYDKIFKEAQEEYDAKQKRNDRKIHDYFDKLFGDQPHADDLIVQNNNKQKSFYEYVVGIGDKDTMGYETNPEGAAIAEKILREYAEGFQKRNPNFFVFNAVMHRDEATPHLHFDYIPYTDNCKKGMKRQQGIARALEEMGYGVGDHASVRFVQAERKVFREICERYGITPAEEKESRGYTFTVEEYKEYRETISDFRNEIQQAEEDLQKTSNELTKKNKELKETDNKLDDLKSSIEENREKLEYNKTKLENINVQISVNQEKRVKLQIEAENIEQEIELLKAEKTLENFIIPPRPEKEHEMSESDWKSLNTNFKKTLFKSAAQLQDEAYQEYVSNKHLKNEEIQKKQEEWDEYYEPIKCAKELLKLKKDIEKKEKDINAEVERKANNIINQREVQAIGERNRALAELDEIKNQRDAAIQELKNAEIRGYNKAKYEYERYIEDYEYHTTILKENIHKYVPHPEKENIHSRDGMCR